MKPKQDKTKASPEHESAFNAIRQAIVDRLDSVRGDVGGLELWHYDSSDEAILEAAHMLDTLQKIGSSKAIPF